jgi:hypothetical protein
MQYFPILEALADQSAAGPDHESVQTFGLTKSDRWFDRGPSSRSTYIIDLVDQEEWC